MTNAQIAFVKLAAALMASEIPVDAPESFSVVYRKATPDEFMFMHYGEEGWHFKHRATRNYLIVKYDGKVSIPKGGPFCGGFYGPAPEPTPPMDAANEALRTAVRALSAETPRDCLEALQSAPDEPGTRLCRALLLDEYGFRTSDEAAEKLQDALRESREMRASMGAQG